MKKKSLSAKGRAKAISAARAATGRIARTASRLSHPIVFIRTLIANLILLLSKFVKDVASITQILDKATKAISVKGAAKVTKLGQRIRKRTRIFSTKLSGKVQLPIVLLALLAGLTLSQEIQLLKTEHSEGIPVTLDCPVIQKGHQPDIDLVCITLGSDTPMRGTFRLSSSVATYEPYLPMPLMYHPATNYYEQAEETWSKVEKFLMNHWKEILGFVVATTLVDNSSTRFVLLLAMTSYMMSPVKANEVQVEIRDLLQEYVARPPTSGGGGGTTDLTLTNQLLNNTLELGLIENEFIHPGYNKALGRVQSHTIMCSAYACRYKYGVTTVSPITTNIYWASQKIDTIHFFIDPGWTYNSTHYCTTGVVRMALNEFGTLPTITVVIDSNGQLGPQSTITRADLTSFTGLGAFNVALVPRWTADAHWTLQMTAWTECYHDTIVVGGAPRIHKCSGKLIVDSNMTDARWYVQILGNRIHFRGIDKRGQTFDVTILNDPVRNRAMGFGPLGDLSTTRFRTFLNDTGFELYTETGRLGVQGECKLSKKFRDLIQPQQGMGSGCVSLATHDILTTGTTSWTEFTVTHGQCVSVKATGKPTISFTYVGGDYANALIPDRAFLLRSTAAAVEFHDRCPSAGTAVCQLDGTPNTVTTYTFNDRGWGNGCGLFAKGSICGTITLSPVLTNLLHVYDIDYDKVDHKLEISLASGGDTATVLTMPGIATSDTEASFGAYGSAFIRCSPATTTKWAASKWTIFAGDGGANLEPEGWAIPRDAYRVLHLPWMALNGNGSVEGNILEPEKMIKWGTPRANTIDYSLKEAGKGSLINQFAKYPHYPMHGRGPLGVPDVLNCRVKTADLKWYGAEVPPCADYPTKILYDEHPQVDQNGLVHISVQLDGLGNHTCRLTSKLTLYNEDRAPLAGLQMGTDPILDSSNNTGMLHYRVPSGPHYLWIGSGTTALKIALDNKRSYATGVLSDVGSVWRNFISTSGVSTPDDVAGGPMAKGAKMMGNFLRGFSHNLFGASGVLWDYAIAFMLFYIAANFFEGKVKLIIFVLAGFILFSTYVSGANANIVETIGRKTASLVDGVKTSFSSAYYKELNNRRERFDPTGYIFGNCRYQLAKAQGYVKTTWHYYLGCLITLYLALKAFSQDPLWKTTIIGVFLTLGYFVLCTTVIAGEGTYSASCKPVFAELGLDWEVTLSRQYTIFTSFAETAWAQKGAWALGVINYSYADRFLLPALYVLAAGVSIFAAIVATSKSPATAVTMIALIAASFFTTTFAQEVATVDVLNPEPSSLEQQVYWDHQAIESVLSFLQDWMSHIALLGLFFAVAMATTMMRRTYVAPKPKVACTVLLLTIIIAGPALHYAQPELPGLKQANEFLRNTKHTPLLKAASAVPLLFMPVDDNWYFYAYTALLVFDATPIGILPALLANTEVFNEILLAYCFGDPIVLLFRREARLLTASVVVMCYVTMIPFGVRMALFTCISLFKRAVTLSVIAAICYGTWHFTAFREVTACLGLLALAYQVNQAYAKRKVGWKASAAMLGVIASVCVITPFIPTEYTQHMTIPLGAVIIFSMLGERLKVVATGATRTVKVATAVTKEFPSPDIFLDENGDFIPVNSSPIGIYVLGATLITSFYFGPAAFVVGLLVLAAYTMKFAGSDEYTPEVEPLKQDGPVYIMKDYYGLFHRKIGTGYVYKGVLHTSEHVTNMEDVEWLGRTWSPVMINRFHDVITYGGDYCFADPSEGEATVVVVRRGVRYEERVALKKMSRPDIYTAATDVMQPGDSGSPLFQDGHPVGVAGNMARADGQNYIIAGAVPITLKPTQAMYDACERHGISLEAVHYPGAGKTRNVAFELIKKCKALNRQVWVTVPTRVVAVELKEALGDVSYVSHTRAFRSTSVGSKVHIICHSTFLQIIATEAPKISGLVLMDESHFADDKSQALKHWLRDQAAQGNISLVEMTATGDSATDTSSRFPIDDVEMRIGELPGILKKETADNGRKVILFTPSTSYRPVLRALKDANLTCEVIHLNRKTFAENNKKARELEKGLIVATNIAEVGGNYGVDVVIDLRMTIYPVIDQENGVFLTTRECSKSSSVQRRGRVGRSRPGIHYYVGEPGEYHIWPLEAAQHFELGIWLSLLGMAPLPTTPAGANFDNMTTVQRTIFLKNVEDGMSTYFAWQLAVRNVKNGSDLLGAGVDYEGEEYTTFDQRHAAEIQASITQKKPISEFTRAKFSATWTDTLFFWTSQQTAIDEKYYVGIAIIATVIILCATTCLCTVVKQACVEVFTTIRSLLESIIRTDLPIILLPLLYMFFGVDLQIDGVATSPIPKEAIGLFSGLIFLSVAKASEKSYAGLAVTVLMCLPKVITTVPMFASVVMPSVAVPAMGVSPYLVSTSIITAVFLYQTLGETAYCSSVLNQLVRLFEDVKLRHTVQPVTTYRNVDWASALGLAYMVATKTLFMLAPGIALGVLLLMVAKMEGRTKALIAYLTGKEEIDAANVPEPTNNEERRLNVKVVIAIVGTLGSCLTATPHGLVCTYPLLAHFLYRSGIIKERMLADYPAALVVMSMGTGDVYLTALAGIYLYLKRTYKFGKGGTLSVIEGKYNEWKETLRKMDSYTFNKYKSRHIWERPVDTDICSRGTYKLQFAINKSYHKPSGKVVDLGCGAGGFSQAALATGKVRSVLGVGIGKAGHHEPRLDKVKTLGYNLFNFQQGDAYQIEPPPCDTLYWDIGESHQHIDVERERTTCALKRIDHLMDTLKPKAWYIKVHAAHSDINLTLCRALQTKYGGGFHRNPFSRNSNAEIYYTEGVNTTAETTLLALASALSSRRRDGPTHYVDPIIYPKGVLNFTPTSKNFKEPTLRMKSCGCKSTLDQPYLHWKKWGEVRTQKDRVNSENRNPIIEGLTRNLRRMVHGANDWAVTETSAVGVQDVFSKKIDTAPVNKWSWDTHLSYFKIMKFVGKTMPTPRVLTDEEVVKVFRNDAAIGALPVDASYDNVSQAFEDPNFWKAVREEEKLHETCSCSRGIFNTMGKTERKRKKGAYHGRPSSRMIAYLPLVERFLEQKYLGWINQDHWTDRERLPAGIGGMPIHYLGGLLEKMGKPDCDGTLLTPAVQTDIAGWDTRLGLPFLDAEQSQLSLNAEPYHAMQIAALYNVYKKPLILIKRPDPKAPGYAITELIQTEGQRMSGTVVTYTMNTITNTCVNLFRTWESFGKPDLDTFLEQKGVSSMERMAISGDDCVIFPERPSDFAKSLTFLNETGLTRKDIGQYEPDRLINMYDELDMCSHRFRRLRLKEGQYLAVVAKPEEEILGKGMFTIGFMTTPAIPCMAKAMANYWMMIFPYQRDIRLAARAIRSCVDEHAIPLGKIKDPYITEQPWMTTEDIFSVWHRIWIENNPFLKVKPDITSWDEVPYLTQMEDIALGSAIHNPERTVWKNNLAQHVRSVRNIWNQQNTPDEILGLAPQTSWI